MPFVFKTILFFFVSLSKPWFLFCRIFQVRLATITTSIASYRILFTVSQHKGRSISPTLEDHTFDSFNICVILIWFIYFLVKSFTRLSFRPALSLSLFALEDDINHKFPLTRLFPVFISLYLLLLFCYKHLPFILSVIEKKKWPDHIMGGTGKFKNHFIQLTKRSIQIKHISLSFIMPCINTSIFISLLFSFLVDAPAQSCVGTLKFLGVISEAKREGSTFQSKDLFDRSLTRWIHGLKEQGCPRGWFMVFCGKKNLGFIWSFWQVPDPMPRQHPWMSPTRIFSGRFKHLQKIIQASQRCSWWRVFLFPLGLDTCYFFSSVVRVTMVTPTGHASFYKP